LLICNLKFDLRIYVVVTCLDPLRIYVYNEWLARFCTDEFNFNNLENKFAHLTNYSVNKKNAKFIPNTNSDCDDSGNKWSLSALNRYLEKMGIDLRLLWSRIYDEIIKSIISVEPLFYSIVKKLSSNRTNCYELFGYDILIDSNLKPWIMEVNLTPSLLTESPLDFVLKNNLIRDIMNLIGVFRFDRKKEFIQKSKVRSSVSKIKQGKNNQAANKCELPNYNSQYSHNSIYAVALK